MNMLENLLTGEFLIENPGFSFLTKSQKQVINLEPKVKRNQLCPCGSGKKFKKCCLNGVKESGSH